MNQTEPGASPDPYPQRSGTRRRWWTLAGVALLLVLVAATWRLTRTDTSGAPADGAKSGRAFDASSRPISVAAQPVTIAPKFDILLGALGTVIARNTVVVHVRVDGQLTRVAFREGQLVRQGDLLAQIDPRPFQVVLDNAQGTLARDKAQLANAVIDLERYRGLIAEDSIPKQTYDSQVALVEQDKALVAADQAQVDSAKLQLSFTQVTAPVSGRVGLRQVDQGNMVHASDTNGLVVITEVQPIDVIFPIPQDRLPAVRRRLAQGARLPVDAYESDNRTLLGTGTLLTTDNQIDTSTGTVKLKAEFANRDTALFPNQFVNVRLHLDQVDNALTVPSAAVQRGAPGTFVYVVRDDKTVQIRTLTLGPAEGERVQVLDGLAAGDKVVTDGIDKLRDGATVVLIDASARTGPGDTAPGPGQRRKGKSASSPGGQ
jgi:multidrug efflux system membrane fusion protein